VTDSVEVYPLRLLDAPEEIWYGVRVNGRDRQAGWADPEAARRWGEKVAAEAAVRRGGQMETVKPNETEEPTLPDEPETPVEEPATEPDEEEKTDADRNRETVED